MRAAGGIPWGRYRLGIFIQESAGQSVTNRNDSRRPGPDGPKVGT